MALLLTLLDLLQGTGGGGHVDCINVRTRTYSRMTLLPASGTSTTSWLHSGVPWPACNQALTQLPDPLTSAPCPKEIPSWCSARPFQLVVLLSTTVS